MQYGQLGPTCDMQFVMTIFCSSVLTVTKTKGKFVARSFDREWSDVPQ